MEVPGPPAMPLLHMARDTERVLDLGPLSKEGATTPTIMPTLQPGRRDNEPYYATMCFRKDFLDGDLPRFGDAAMDADHT